MTKYRSRRIVNHPIPPRTPCVYCGNPATEWDHITPYSFSGNNRRENLIPACRECNGLASSKVFDSFEAKRLYILDRKAHRRGLQEAYCPKGCGVTYARIGQIDYCPDCGERL